LSESSDESQQQEEEARERLRDAEADAKETLEQAERLEQDGDSEPRNDSPSE